MFGKRNRLIAYFLFVLILSIAPLSLAAITQDRDLLDNSVQMNEIMQMRTLNSRVYDMGNGNVQFHIYPENIFYYDDANILQEIDTSLYPMNDGGYSSGANEFQVYFSDSFADSNAVRIIKGDYSLALTPTATFSANSPTASTLIAAEAGAVEKPNLESQTNLLADSTASISGAQNNTVTYGAIDEGVDMSFEVLANGLACNMIISETGSSKQFVYNLQCENLTPVFDDGHWVFADSSDAIAFSLGDGYIISNDGSQYGDLTYDIEQTSNGYQLILTVNTEGIPVESGVELLATVNFEISGVNTLDTFVSYNNPSTSYNSNSYLRIASDTTYGTTRSFLKFVLPTEFWQYSMSGAYLRLCKASGVAPSMRAYRVTGTLTSSTTWNAQPGWSSSSASATATLYSGQWYQANVTNIVDGWRRDDYSNQGFLIMANNESSSMTTFYSSNNSSNRPILIINASTNPRTFTLKPIYYDASSSAITSTLNSVKSTYLNTFKVTWNNSSPSSSSALAVTSCTTGDQICSTACGALNTCNTVHHKGANRLLGVATDTSYNHVMRFVGYPICYWSTSHNYIDGLSNVGNFTTLGRNSVISMHAALLLKVANHELTHALGVGGHCTASNCVMATGSTVTTTWCAAHLKEVRLGLQP